MSEIELERSRRDAEMLRIKTARDDRFRSRGQLLISIVGLGAIGVIGAAVLMLTHHAKAPPSASPTTNVAAGPPSIASVDSSFSSATVAGDTLTVHERLPEAWDLDGYVMNSAMAAESLGRAIQKGGYAENMTGVKTVIITAKAPTQDRLGHDEQTPFMTFSLSADDLRAANFDNLQWPGVLDLAQLVQVENPAAYKAVAAYCFKHIDVSPSFCKKAAG